MKLVSAMVAIVMVENEFTEKKVAPQHACLPGATISTIGPSGGERLQSTKTCAFQREGWKGEREDKTRGKRWACGASEGDEEVRRPLRTTKVMPVWLDVAMTREPRLRQSLRAEAMQEATKEQEQE